MIMEIPLLIESLSGLVIFIVTAIIQYVTKITKNKIKGEWVVAFLSLVAGAAYYWINKENPNLVEQLGTFLFGAFAVSQIIYLYIYKKIK